MPGKDDQERQNQKQKECQSGIFDGDHRQNGENAAGIRNHADDARCEQCFQGVHIARKTRRDLSRVLPNQGFGGQAGHFFGHFGAEGMCHFLAQQDKERFLRGGKNAFQRKGTEIEQNGGEYERDAAGQVVDDVGKQKRGNQGCQYRCCHTQDGANGENLMIADCSANGRKYIRAVFMFHGRSLLSDFRKASDMREVYAAALHGCRRSLSRFP
ncbi:unknown [Clostridium sp. CAG:448]|nr:unknown [Clostridium sp. CAG:448]